MSTQAAPSPLRERQSVDITLDTGASNIASPFYAKPQSAGRRGPARHAANAPTPGRARRPCRASDARQGQSYPTMNRASGARGHRYVDTYARGENLGWQNPGCRLGPSKVFVCSPETPLKRCPPERALFRQHFGRAGSRWPASLFRSTAASACVPSSLLVVQAAVIDVAVPRANGSARWCRPRVQGNRPGARIVGDALSGSTGPGGSLASAILLRLPPRRDGPDAMTSL